MPLKLHAGLSKKVGLPAYGSLGASCHIEIELETSLLVRDPDGFQQQVQQAFGVCARAVQSELDRQTAVPDPSQKDLCATNGHANAVAPPGNPAVVSTPESSATNHGTNGRTRGTRRKATASQVRAIFAIGHRLQLNITAELQQRFQLERPEDLSIGDASEFIDELQRLHAAAGGER